MTEQYKHNSIIYKKIEEYILKIFQNKIFVRSCVILVKGAHLSGKTWILQKIKESFNKKTIYLNINKEFSFMASYNNSNLREKVFFAKLSEKIDELGKISEILLLDHLEILYYKYNFIKDIIRLFISKSRQLISTKNKPLIIIFSFPIDEQLQILNEIIENEEIITKNLIIYNLNQKDMYYGNN